MEDWGKIILKQINSDDFWCLYDELLDDNSGFFYNRSTILEAYRDKNLYGLTVLKTDEMYERGSRMDKIFCNNEFNNSFYLLPCFCIKENNKAVIIWTHTRARNMGFAKKLVELLNIEYAYCPLEESIGFWEKCNIKLIK